MTSGRVVITEHGPAAVMLSVEDLQSLEEGSRFRATRR
ncbi:MAG TPA: type II toxin-antitoxin system prevent-host-death family antitoxin [Acidimicrobiia bacterium]|nr:type II toxin-antitoxin system prevent-host-death family antitoxin [Acidimicrobiia bacterium]